MAVTVHFAAQASNMSVGAGDQPARDASKRASYVPRYAARQFAATTTTATNGDEYKDAMKRAKTVKERPKPSFEAAPRSINPKQLQARLSMGMSENEAMSAAVAAPPSARPDLGRSNSASSVEKADKKHRSSRKDRARSDASDLKSKRSVVRRPGPPREIESSENTMTAYQPGDAAKRKAEKRSSQAFPAPRPLGYVAEYSLQFADLQAETGKALGDRAEEDVQMAMRPTTLRPHDRPNWTQQSQCGDDMRHALGSNWRRRKSAGDRNEALQALEGSGGAAAAAAPPRKSTSGARLQEDQTLISDAVKQINREKKSKRRQSVMALFRKL
ncbi:hypothetical protein NU219Hw_g1449t1 [Hortaea werneckii]